MSWGEALRRALISGTTASVVSAAMLAICGRIERGTAAGPNNGPSQWVWGEGAAYERRPTVRHTAVGYAIHHLMSIGWATLYEKHAMDPTIERSGAGRLAASATTAAVACFVDYRVAPRRLRPGFEKQLGRASLFMVYAAFALGLAVAEPVRATLRALRPRSTPTGERARHGIAHPRAGTPSSRSSRRTSADGHGHH